VVKAHLLYPSHEPPAASAGCAPGGFEPSSHFDLQVITLVDADLNFLVLQNERILTSIASLRDDMAVLTAMVMRLEGSHAALLQETRATHAQIARMNDRIRRLEAKDEVT
jgi:hypothetical protein